MTQQCAFHTLTNPFMATTKEYGRSSFSQDVGKKNQQNGWYNRSPIRPKRKDQNVSQNSMQDFGGRINLFQKKRFPFGKERKKKFLATSPGPSGGIIPISLWEGCRKFGILFYLRVERVSLSRHKLRTHQYDTKYLNHILSISRRCVNPPRPKKFLFFRPRYL